MGISFNGDWIQFPKDLRRMAKVLTETAKKATKQNALLLQREIKLGITNQAPGGKKFQALKQATIDAKGSSKALINHGDLRRSITVSVFKGGEEAFIGVNRNAKATEQGGKRSRRFSKLKGGKAVTKELFNIAQIHEFGTTKTTHIPARPFIGPSFRKLKPDLVRHYDQTFKGSFSRFRGKGGS